MTDITDLVLEASVATVWSAGPLPEAIEDAPAHIARWFQMMRDHDPRLGALTDAQIQAALNGV
jgi:hypothetical protein